MSFHFYGSNLREWKTSENIHEVINWFVGQKHPYQLWYVPLPDDAQYEIDFYAPQVKGAIFLNSYIHEVIFNH